MNTQKRAELGSAAGIHAVVVAIMGKHTGSWFGLYPHVQAFSITVRYSIQCHSRVWHRHSAVKKGMRVP